MPPLRRKDERKRVDFGEGEEGENAEAINVYDVDEALYGKIGKKAGPLVKIVEGNIQTQGFTLTSTGLQVSGTVTEENWSEVGKLLFRLEGSIQWLIGDWLAYGMKLTWGDIPRIAEVLGRDERQLHRYKQMATAFDYARRRVELSFGHHECVRALLPDAQDEALDYAAQSGLSVSDFRKWIGERFRGHVATLPSGDERNYKILSAQFEKWRAADPAKAKPQDLEQVRFVREQMRRELEEFERKWGL